MLLPIVRYNNSLLRKRGEPIKTFDSKLTDLANDMLETMHEAEGIGLAAQQIGKPIQLCVVDLRGSKWEFNWEFDGARPPRDIFMPLALVNPELKIHEGLTTVYEEGCLSFPGIHGDVIRPDKITVKFQDLQGNPHLLTCTGILSRCVQHEADHLNGVLFIDQMAKKVLSQIEPELKALKKQTRDEMKKTPAG